MRNTWIDRNMGWIAPFLASVVMALFLWGVKLHGDVRLLEQAVDMRSVAEKDADMRRDEMIGKIGCDVSKVREDMYKVKEVVTRLDARFEASQGYLASNIKHRTYISNNN